MKTRPAHLSTLTLLCATAALSGCGGVNLWPFEPAQVQLQSRVPPNATAYQCDEGKRFFVRYPEGGAAAWVILSDREFRLDKVAAAGNRYSNGRTALEVESGGVSLNEGSAPLFTGCKSAAG